MIAERERDDIAEWLDDLLTEWVEQTSKRETGEQLANRVRRLFRMSRDENPTAGRFAKYTRPVDAVIDLLQQEDRPLPPDEIMAEVLGGGFRPLNKDREADLKKCLGAYAPDARKGRKALRWVGGFPGDDGRWSGGLIGIGHWPKGKWPEGFRAEWPEERFK